jgi:hypothetical protein
MTGQELYLAMVLAAFGAFIFTLGGVSILALTRRS